MRRPVPEGVFKAKPTAIESRQDAITKAARSIIDSEVSAREVKTRRLRAARLAAQTRATSTPAQRLVAKRKTPSSKPSLSGAQEGD